MTPADWSIITGVLVIAAVDVLFIIYKIPTISRRFWVVGREITLLPYVWGVLGSFQGGAVEVTFRNWWALIGLRLMVSLLVTVTHRLILWLTGPPSWVVLICLLCGIPTGILYWPQ